ncbi:hypothetical protein Q674_00595 [Acinetobacter sp. COS3]|nr:hypothetical protein Q674_00595 [Acinetobacter sp. COS3]
MTQDQYAQIAIVNRLAIPQVNQTSVWQDLTARIVVKVLLLQLKYKEIKEGVWVLF